MNQKLGYGPLYLLGTIVLSSSVFADTVTEFVPKHSSATVVVEPNSPNTIVVKPKATSDGNSSPTVVIQPGSSSSKNKQPVVIMPVVQENVSDNERKVEDLGKKAQDFTKKKGRETAFVEFNKSNGEFTKGTYYIFAMSYKGQLLADGFNKEMIGKNQFDLQDLNGKYINRDMISKAQAGGGWEVYHWINPVTKSMECKKTFVLPMEGYFIASGYYFLPNADGKCD
jgi:cytochrome c